MPQEVAPASVAADGNLRITYVPSGNALSVAILNGGTSVPLTYSFTPDGFNRTITENTVDDPRLTLKQTFSAPGTSSEALEVKYVLSTTTGSAQVTLPEGTTGQLNLRYGIPNATAFTTGQRADVVTFIAGKQRKDAPAANSVMTITQTLFITALTVTDGVLVA
jgi:hypothetical protein